MLKNLIYLSGFSLFVVIVIIALNIYHNSTISTLPAITQTRIIQITPTFDKTTIDNLKKRKQINVDLNEKSTITSVDSKSASESAAVEVTPTVAVKP
jgi:hypothetical protein